jgi:hypothetical protein
MARKKKLSYVKDEQGNEIAAAFPQPLASDGSLLYPGGWWNA